MLGGRFGRYRVDLILSGFIANSECVCMCRVCECLLMQFGGICTGTFVGVAAARIKTNFPSRHYYTHVAGVVFAGQYVWHVA